MRDVYDFLEDIRLRPGMYAFQSSVLHLQSILLGFNVAVEIHGTAGSTAFDAEGAFHEWLRHQINGQYGCLIWGYAIELEAKDRGVPPMDLFFELLDKFRAERCGKTFPTSSSTRLRSAPPGGLPGAAPRDAPAFGPLRARSADARPCKAG
ncbi:hypothetical protein [Streptomyces sp. NBC_01276]|uniref:hypothetical protein n=1 Tax=Streptomyces sp. NBC_01276 TaxID=2903808 RepID=UPI00352DC40F